MNQDIIGERLLISSATGKVEQSLGPIYAEDWPYLELPPHQTLLRYMDLWKFEDLLESRSLYFCRADKLEPLEGTISKEGVEQTSQSDAALNSSIEISHPSHKDKEAYRETAKGVTFVNCWHINNMESQKMWDAYTTTPDSVLLITSVGRLKDSLDRQVTTSAVKYVTEDTPRTEFGERSLFLYKDVKYSFEQEYRLIVDICDMDGPNGFVDPTNPKDNFRRVGLIPESLVCGLQPHPNADVKTKEKIGALVCKYLPDLTPHVKSDST